MAGFCRIMKEEKNSQNQKFMLDYLISLLDDANNFSWDAAKASHAVLLCRMEQGEVVSYEEIDKIDRIRRAKAQRHTPQSQYSTHPLNKVRKNANKPTKSMPCQYFNQGSCVHQKSHDTKGALYIHICAACFASHGKTYPHPKIDCRNKLRKSAKNE